MKYFISELILRHQFKCWRDFISNAHVSAAMQRFVHEVYLLSLRPYWHLAELFASCTTPGRWLNILVVRRCAVFSWLHKEFINSNNWHTSGLFCWQAMMANLSCCQNSSSSFAHHIDYVTNLSMFKQRDRDMAFVPGRGLVWARLLLGSPAPGKECLSDLVIPEVNCVYTLEALADRCQQVVVYVLQSELCLAKD